MYTNPYLVLNEKGRPKKKLSSFHSLFNLYFDQYEVMPHSIILRKQPI